jgi:phosphatidylglycerophosphate synthase
MEHHINAEIFKDRKRTNILRTAEQKAISWLVTQVPGFITPNILTGIGLAGSLMVLIAFLLARYIHVNYLLIGIGGLIVNWLGDSLDGRIAYFRNIARKWYGFSLDIIMDWIGTVLIGMGYIVYTRNEYELIGFIFVVLYGWAMIISQLRYKITDQYTIDAGLFGPTEVRVLIAMILILEVLFTGSILYCGILMCIALGLINLLDTRKLLAMGDLRDAAEKLQKANRTDE